MNFTEAKLYSSEKHKMYGYRSEASVLPNGICICSSEHVSGSVANIMAFRKNMLWNQMATAIIGDEMLRQDLGELEESHPENWAIVSGKGYQGLAEQM